ncbi:MAG: hypothetical protein CVV61_03680 [Tenericutes bacterium HGW-Tenericutes-6]|nr:MAG: hypothetical protein CVV61_03680 [Tenericutes bacterium HGW-Tenericutes-6]
MKKVLLALILLASAFGFLGTRSFAAGTGNLVIHFQKWDGDYTDVGFFTWTAPFTTKAAVDGTDEFGVYFEYNDIAIGSSLTGIVYFQEAGKEWWENKLTADINFGDILVEDETVHVYVFEGLDTAGPNASAFFVADPAAYNMLLVYYDPTGNYEETLGVHAWNGWTSFTEPGWASPAQVFEDGGKASDGSIVKVAMLSASSPNAGLLIYAGDDSTKKTGDVNLSAALPETPVLGDTGVAYVLSKGDAYTANDNVWYNDNTDFVTQAFSFRLIEFNNDDKTGTYAVDPTTIIVKTSKLVTNPYAEATTTEEQAAAVAQVESWFTVREMTGVDTYGEPLDIERVDFAKSNATINAFVVILGEALDNTKDYEIFFETNFPETLDVAVDVDVTIEVTVPANTPAEAVLSIAGSMQGWSPNAVDYQATQVGTTNVYTLTFTVSVTDPFTTYEYKWTRGDWANEEFIASNRKLIVPNNVTAITIEDEVEAWADIDAPAEKYAAPDRVAPTVPANLAASLAVSMDTSKPVLTFISPTGIVDKVEAERIITVAWGQPFDPNLFPRFRVIDDRDGEITPFVYVPKGEFSVLDTRTEGDYVIMLRVVDRWGNITEEKFTFRVVKP